MKIQGITFAGHSAVFLKADQVCVAIDPWLQANPACPAELKTPEALDLILLTHGHADHAGEAAALAKKYGSTIIATYELGMIMVQQGVPQDNVILMNKGGTVEWQGLKITLTNAFHSSGYESADGMIYAGEPCGVVIADAERRIYHAGDTCIFSDMALIKELYQPEIALLPIGDRFTMGPLEAAKAASLVGCKLAIPIHYKTFDLLTGTPEEFEQECGKLGIEVITLDPGHTHQIP